MDLNKVLFEAVQGLREREKRVSEILTTGNSDEKALATSLLAAVQRDTKKLEDAINFVQDWAEREGLQSGRGMLLDTFFQLQSSNWNTNGLDPKQERVGRWLYRKVMMR